MNPGADPELKVSPHIGDRPALTEPRAESARYDVASGRVIVDLTNGCTFAFPAHVLQGLGGDTARTWRRGVYGSRSFAAQKPG